MTEASLVVAAKDVKDSRMKAMIFLGNLAETESELVQFDYALMYRGQYLYHKGCARL